MEIDVCSPEFHQTIVRRRPWPHPRRDQPGDSPGHGFQFEMFRDDARNSGRQRRISLFETIVYEVFLVMMQQVRLVVYILKNIM